MNTRSPGPTNRSKLIQGSNYAAHQSFRDEDNYGLSPDTRPMMKIDSGNVNSNRVNRDSSVKPYDEYEDLLNTIEQEQSTVNGGFMGAKNSRSELRKQSVQADTTSIMTMDRAGAKNSQANNRNEQENEPMIDFDLEQEMIGFDNEKNKAKKSKITGPTKKANLNESSDFDLDNY